MALTLSSYNDDELVEQFNQGSSAAFKEIYMRYWPLLLQVSFKVTRDQQQAEDIVQDVFEGVLQKMGNLYVQKSLSALLYQSTRYKMIDSIRKSKLCEKYLCSLQKDIGYNNADEELRLKELQAIIESEVSKLPPKMRAVFEMSRKAYLSYQEIAEHQQTSIETVRKQLHLSLKVLRGKLGCWILLSFMQFLLWLYR